MKFGSNILCLALATTTTTSGAAAFSPATPSSKSIRMGRDLIPKDLIASNLKLKQSYGLTNTLRWEIRSTLTSSDEEASTKTEEKPKEDGPDGDLPPFPEQLRTGIWDIQNQEQHT